MNLERLYIENYKQLRDPVELHPPEGAIGIVGSNGAGKSTLFESILWAFFGSKGAGPRFANESIPWSGGSAKDPTVVEVTLATEGGSYTVRRQLRSAATNAEARDDSGKTVVTGTTDVTRWVEESLLHMDRAAFEATFYARQKELKFFASDDGISRVRRISKMLGIDSVRVAQDFLREDRNELRREARLIEGRLAEADEDTIREGLETARAECSRLEEKLEKASGEHEAAVKELEAARESRAALDAAYREHTKLTGQLREAEGNGRRAGDRATEARKDLEELDAAGEELGRIKPGLARMPDLERELEQLEKDRSATEQRDRDRKELRQGQTRIAAIESEVYESLEELDGDAEEEPLPGWSALFDLDGSELLEQATMILGEAAGELGRAESHQERLRELAAAHESYRIAGEEEDTARNRHEEARAEARRLGEELEDLSGDENLETRERELREEEEKLRELAATHRGRAAAAEREAKNVDKARQAIDSGAEDHCPTCHREFESGEQDEISETLQRQAAAIRRRASSETEEARKFAASADSTGEKLQKVTGKLERWRELREALARAKDRVSDRLETLKKAEEHRKELGAHISETAAPTEDDLAEARARCEHLRSLRDARPQVVSLSGEHSRLVERVAELAAGLEKLAGISYDAEVHRQKREERALLERTQGRVQELERRIATRQEVEQALEAARAGVEEAEKAAGELRQKISALGFDEAGYEAAGEKVSAIEERVSALRDARERLGGEWKDADHLIERAREELGRLDSDRKLANKKAAEAARMDEMDGLFTEFFRSLTARARPMLETEASNLVRDLTDGRYERMEFDENYRVRLLDRFDDSYAIERFSGGESDVASLSARVALSKIIAARGSGTLGFLVLDEVFGSLDAGRRTNVLMALERLKRSFGQIFVISHVADVQESALLDELWMIEEDEDGKSAISRVKQSAEDPAELLEKL